MFRKPSQSFQRIWQFPSGYKITTQSESSPAGSAAKRQPLNSIPNAPPVLQDIVSGAREAYDACEQQVQNRHSDLTIFPFQVNE